MVKGINKDFRDLEFKVNEEPWNTYELQETGILLKQKYVLTRILVKKNDSGQMDFRLKRETHTIVTNVKNSLYGLPSNVPKREYPKYVDHEENFKIINEDWNEYITIPDGFKFRVKSTLSLVQHTSLFDVDGEPIYLCQYAEQIMIQRPKIEQLDN